MPLPLRVLVAFLLFLAALFCGFGFRATLELLDPSERWAWRMIYGAAGVVCLASALWMVRPWWASSWRRGQQSSTVGTPPHDSASRLQD
jgi:hypothetical protein